MVKRIPAELLRGVSFLRSRRGLRLPASAARKLGIVLPESGKKGRGTDPFDPQERLAEALRRVLGPDEVQCEVTGLVPGRRYRADIVIPRARLVIEFDGFRYHRSKSAFQADRERQNAFVAHGWRVLRFFHRQVRNDLDKVVAQIVSLLTSCAQESAQGDAHLSSCPDGS